MGITQAVARLLKLTSGGGLADDGSGGVYVKGVRPFAADPGSPADGDIWYNTTDKLFRGRTAGLSHVLSMSGFTVTASTSITNSTSAVAISTCNPNNSNLTVGRCFRHVSMGRVSYDVTGVTHSLSFFPAADSDADGAFVQIPTIVYNYSSSASNAAWRLETVWTVRSTGATGTLVGNAIFSLNGTVIQSASNPTITVNLTSSDMKFQLFAQWGTASTGNSISCDQTFLEWLS